MPPLPSPSLTISKTEARRFILAHQRLWPPRSFHGKQGALAFIRHVGCIQYDPLNVVGQNPDLVLQSRIADYTPSLLEEMLYTDRDLLNGWDKVASIYPVEDWPNFARHRARMEELHGNAESPAMQIAPQVKEAIQRRGPLCSLDLRHGQNEKVDWFWAPARLARACLGTMYAMGEVGIHHRVGTRRYFDLIERLLPSDTLATPDPNPTQEAYWDWHVLRRVGGLGLAQPGTSEFWLGILNQKSSDRRETLCRLVDQGRLIAVAVEDQPRQHFMCTADLPTLQAIQEKGPSELRAAFIAPLDNLIWDRNLLRWIFDFDYAWEVYKPPKKRKYGYYVLPVLYSDRFVARWDPAFDKKPRLLTIQNWWWEENIQPDDTLMKAIKDCLSAFCRYLNVSTIQIGPKAKNLGFLQKVIQELN